MTDNGASAKADRVLSATPTEPVVSAHSGDAPLREIIDKARRICKTASEIGCGNPEDVRIDAIFVLAAGILNRAKRLNGQPSSGRRKRPDRSPKSENGEAG